MRMSIECLTLREIRDLEDEGLEGSIERKRSISLFM
jgi:hypothetical protein